MTTELATVEPIEGALVAAGPDPFTTLGRYLSLMDDARKFADTVCMTPMVPKFYQGNPKAATVAILHGAELGLHPLQALQQIFVVHGMPAIYARTMVALLKNRGFRFDTIETGPGRVVFRGWSPDGKESEVSTWTIERADQAGYVPKVDPATGVYAVNKNGNLVGNEKYITEPEIMLWAKAAAEVCRRLAPDVLLGIPRTVEDIESEPEPVRVKSERVPVEEIATGNAAAEAPKVQQWQPPAASNSSAKPEDSQAETPAAEPADDVRDESPTVEQITALGAALKAEGLRTRAKQLGYLSEQFKREITDPAELTQIECVQLTQYLTAPQDPPTEIDADAQLPMDGAEGGGR